MIWWDHRFMCLSMWKHNEMNVFTKYEHNVLINPSLCNQFYLTVCLSVRKTAVNNSLLVIQYCSTHVSLFVKPASVQPSIKIGIPHKSWYLYGSCCVVDRWLILVSHWLAPEAKYIQEFIHKFILIITKFYSDYSQCTLIASWQQNLGSSL